MRRPLPLGILAVLVLLGSLTVSAGGAFERQAGALALAASGDGEVRHVDPSNGSDDGDGSGDRPLRTIQKALELSPPGGVVQLAPGTYDQAVRTVRHGEPDKPITITGPADAVVHGAGDNGRVIQVEHDHHVLRGFTIDGRFGGDRAAGYRESLVHAQGKQARSGVRGLKVLDMTLANALSECVRLRYFAVDSEIAGNTISNCGLRDFRFGGGGRNGEAILVGTAPEQTGDGTNPTSDADRSTGNAIHDNTVEGGGECVSVKEGATGNRIESNTCARQLDADSGAIEVRGNANVVRGNTVTEGKGAGIRLAGAAPGDAIDNDVVANTVRANSSGGIHFGAEPQGKVCGNDLSGQTNPWFGRFAPSFRPTAPCPGGADARSGGTDADQSADLAGSSATTTETTPIFEDFSSEEAAASFEVKSGGTWRVAGGVYQLSNPGTKKKANGNVSVHKVPVEGDFSLSARALVEQDTNMVTDDFSVLFGYRNLKNYCYASFNESNDPKTSGVFSVQDGDVRELRDIGTPISAGEFHTIAIEVSGSSVQVFLDGGIDPVATVDAPGCFGGLRQVGFGTRNDPARFDDLEVTQEVAVAPEPEVSPDAVPADLLDLTNWKLELPTGDTKTSVHRIAQPELDSFSVDPWFMVNPAGDGVRFRAPVACTDSKSGPNCGSRTSSNTLYARSELREMSGSTNASWSATSGTHTMEATLAFEALPNDKPHLTGAQIHGGSDDVTTVRLEGRTLWITRDDDTHYAKVTDGYTLGDRITIRYVVKGGEIQVWYQGDLKKTINWNGTTNYFKTGAYTQAHCGNSSPCDGDLNYGEVHMYDLVVTHEP